MKIKEWNELTKFEWGLGLCRQTFSFEESAHEQLVEGGKGKSLLLF